MYRLSRPSPRRFAVTAILLLFAVSSVLVGAAMAHAGVQSEAAGRRIVAVGDIHGAYDSFVTLLQEVGVLDETLAWVGGDTVLVQTGDFVDRGTDVRKVMDLLMRLQQEAPESGGEVVVLLGNHEAMNIVGEIREVTPEIMATFADNETENIQRKVQEEAFKEYAAVFLTEDRDWRMATRLQRNQVQKRWSADQPLGRIEYMRAMGPDGLYGSWIRSLPRTKVIDGILFMHAGIAPELMGWSLEAIDDRIGEEIATLDRYRADLRERDRITSFADIRDIVRGAAVETEGLDWFEAPPEMVRKPPALPPVDLDSVEDPKVRYEPLLRVTGWFLLAERGPIWFRGLAQWEDSEIEGRLPGMLAALGVESMVVGHTPQPEGIRARVGGAVYLIDTGMLTSAYNGKGSALVITGNGVSAVYDDGSRETLTTAEVVSSP